MEIQEGYIMAEKKVRVQFDFTESALQELDNLQAAVGVKTRAEVIRYALRVLQWLIQELRSGGKIIVRHKDGKEEAVVFQFLDSVTKSQQPAASVSA
jgi:DNA primase